MSVNVVTVVYYGIPISVDIEEEAEKVAEDFGLKCGSFGNHFTGDIQFYVCVSDEVGQCGESLRINPDYINAPEISKDQDVMGFLKKFELDPVDFAWHVASVVM